jgi:ABC-2 type transport system permease protein
MNPMTYYIAFKSILAKEVSRFTRIWIQTLVPPAITMSLLRHLRQPHRLAHR